MGVEGGGGEGGGGEGGGVSFRVKVALISDSYGHGSSSVYQPMISSL